MRLWRLGASDLTFDEAATYFVANRPLLDILTYLRGAVREHPPVFYLLVRPWMTFAGTSEYSLRFFAVVVSMIGIALTARLARVLARKRGITRISELFAATFLPALVLALLPFEVYYARDARMYTLTLVWVTLSSLLYLRLLFDADRGKWPNRVELMGLVFVNGLALFTHYYLALLIVSQFVSLLLVRRWRALIAWVAAHGAVGLSGVVWIMRSPGLSSSLDEAWGRFSLAGPTAGQLRRLVSDLLFGPIRGVPWIMVYSWGVLVALGLLAAGLLRLRANRKLYQRRSTIIAVWLAAMTLLPIVLSFLLPEPPRSRYLIFVLPFAALALGQIPFVFAERKWVALVWVTLTVLVISTMGVFGLPRTVKWIKSSYGHTVATVHSHARPGDGVLFYGPWQWAQFHYYRPDEFPPISPIPPQAPPHLVPEEAEPVLRQLLNAHQRLWVIPAAVDDVDPDRFVEGWLNDHAHAVWTTPELRLYVPPVERQELSATSGLIFDDRLQLAHVAGDVRTVPAGESLRLTLTWAVSDTLDGDVQLDLSLVDEQNNRWQQWHSVPGRWRNSSSNWQEGEVIVDREGLIVPQGAPPGHYRVQMIVVDKVSGAPLRPSNADGPLPQDNVDLLTFEVVEPVAQPVLVDVGDFVGPFTFEPRPPAENALILVGYELAGSKFQQGNPVPLRLHWLAPPQSASNISVRLQLRHAPGPALLRSPATPIVSQTLSLVPGYPVNEWRPGRLVSMPSAISIPVDATVGRAELTLSLFGPDGQLWAIDGLEHLVLGTLNVEERPMLRQPPSDLIAVQVDYTSPGDSPNDRIGLRGYRVEGDMQPGGQLELHYAWLALSQPARVYSVFNHLLTADGQFVAQADGWPQQGLVLTKQWRTGEYIQDHHTLEIPADGPPGPYLLAVGLYDAVTEDRLRATYEGEPLIYDQWVIPLYNGE